MAMTAILAVAVIGTFLWVIATRRRDYPQRNEASARAQLDARLARGEIDTQQHRERLEALSGHRA